MITATLLVLIFSPLFYVLIEKLTGKQKRREQAIAEKARANNPEEE